MTDALRHGVRSQAASVNADAFGPSPRDTLIRREPYSVS